MSLRIHTFIITSLALWSLSAEGQVTTNSTYTGAELAAQPGVVFPTRQPVVTGDSLQFLAPGTSSQEVLLRYPLVPEDNVAEGSSVGFIVKLNFVRLTRDNDLRVLIGDGDRLVGSFLRDNSNGISRALVLTDPPGTTLRSAFLFDGAGFAAVGEKSDRTTRVCLDSNSSTVDELYRAKSGRASFPAYLDQTESLSLVLVSGSTNEAYQIDSINVQILRGQRCSDSDITIGVQIDIRPGGVPNPINLKSRGRIPVGVLTTKDFDATSLDVETIRFGGSGNKAKPDQIGREDIDGDGDLDLILHFRIQSLGFDCTTSQGVLTGQTASGVNVLGIDSISPRGCK